MRASLAVIAAALAMLFAQFPVVVLEIDASDPMWIYRVQLFLADIPLAIGAVLALPDLRRALEMRWSRAPLLLALATVALLGVALAVNPSLIGAQTVLRVGAGLALATVVARAAGDTRVLLVGSLAAAGLLQLGLALAQLSRGGPLGLPAIGEFADPLRTVAGSVAPRGTMEHPYVLAALALVSAGLVLDHASRSRRAWAWSLLAAVLSAPVGFTYMRTAALATALATAALLRGAIVGIPARRWALLALVVGTGVPTLLSLDGWLSRAEESLDPAGEPRLGLTREALVMLEGQPVFGIGPGRSAERTRELRELTADPSEDPPPVHTVPLLIAVEAGIPAGLTVSALIVALFAVALRSGRLFLFALFAPFLLLEHFPYTRLQGVVLFAYWAGAICGRGTPSADAIRGSRATRRDPPPAEVQATPR